MSLQQWNEVVTSSNGDQKHHNYLEDKPLCLLFMVNKNMPNSLTPKIYDQEPSNLECQIDKAWWRAELLDTVAECSNKLKQNEDLDLSCLEN